MQGQTMVPVQVRLDASKRDLLKAEAESQERSVNWLLNKIVDDAIQRWDQERCSAANAQ